MPLNLVRKLLIAGLIPLPGWAIATQLNALSMNIILPCLHLVLPDACPEQRIELVEMPVEGLAPSLSRCYNIIVTFWRKFHDFNNR